MPSLPRHTLTTAWLAVVLALLLAVLPTGKLTLCLGHDGHMGLGAFGSAPACHCQHEHQHENQHEGPQERGGAAIAVQRLCQSDEHDSGDCQDISIDLPQLWVSAERSHELSSEQLSPQPMPAFASCLAAALVLAPFEEQEKAWPPPTQSRATRQELDQLRSVVLLI